MDVPHMSVWMPLCLSHSILGDLPACLEKKGAMLYNLTASRKVALKLTRTSHGMFMVSANTKRNLKHN